MSEEDGTRAVTKVTVTLTIDPDGIVKVVRIEDTPDCSGQDSRIRSCPVLELPGGFGLHSSEYCPVGKHPEEYGLHHDDDCMFDFGLGLLQQLHDLLGHWSFDARSCRERPCRDVIPVGMLKGWLVE